jgi:hypothetical protein
MVDSECGPRGCQMAIGHRCFYTDFVELDPSGLLEHCD